VFAFNDIDGCRQILEQVGPRLFDPTTEVMEFDLLSTTATNLIKAMKKRQSETDHGQFDRGRGSRASAAVR
jgi:hypothetical protein